MQFLTGKPLIIRVVLVFVLLTLIFAIGFGLPISALFIASMASFAVVFSYVMFSLVNRDFARVPLYRRDTTESVSLALLLGALAIVAGHGMTPAGGVGIAAGLFFLVFFFVGSHVVEQGELMFFPSLPLEEFE